MRKDVGIALLNLPVVAKTIIVMIFLRRAVFFGAIAGIMVFQKCYCAILPGIIVGCVANQTKSQPLTMPSGMIPFIVS